MTMIFKKKQAVHQIHAKTTEHAVWTLKLYFNAVACQNTMEIDVNIVINNFKHFLNKKVNTNRFYNTKITTVGEITTNA